jgi:hypothetical protein
MNVKRLEQILAAYGAKSERWPETERKDMMALLSQDEHARRLLQDARQLDRLLDSLPVTESQIDPASLAARLSERPQETANIRVMTPSRSRWRLPIIMPNLIGLAAAAVAGFWIGWSDPGRDSVATSDLVSYIADLGGEENSLW